MEQNLTNMRLAVLIDAENVPSGSIKGIMDEVALYGTPTVKRIYGDWTNPRVTSWKKPLLDHAITPVQQYSYTTGKSSSDSALIIDAMDILYADKTDGFVLVSSDSDFTRLATRLRESGQFVLGIGEEKTPPAFIAACDKFTYIEVIRANAKAAARAAEPAHDEQVVTLVPPPKTVQRESHEPQLIQTSAPKKNKSGVPNEIVQLIADSVADMSDDEDGVFMGELGNLIRRKKPDFDFRIYGFKSLTALIKAIDRFSIDFRQTSDPGIKHPYVKDKEA